MPPVIGTHALRSPPSLPLTRPLPDPDEAYPPCSAMVGRISRSVRRCAMRVCMLIEPRQQVTVKQQPGTQGPARVSTLRKMGFPRLVDAAPRHLAKTEKVTPQAVPSPHYLEARRRHVPRRSQSAGGPVSRTGADKAEGTAACHRRSGPADGRGRHSASRLRLPSGCFLGRLFWSNDPSPQRHCVDSGERYWWLWNLVRPRPQCQE